MVKCSFPGWPARLFWKGTVQEATTCINGCVGGEVNRQRWVMNLKWLFMPCVLKKIEHGQACECVGVNSSRIKKELLQMQKNK